MANSIPNKWGRPEGPRIHVSLNEKKRFKGFAGAGCRAGVGNEKMTK